MAAYTVTIQRPIRCPHGLNETGMSKPAILISIETCLETTTKDFGRSFIQSLCDQDVRLVPEKLSTTESYKDSFRGIDDFLINWWAIPEEVRIDGRFSRMAIQGPSWKRKAALAGRGMVEHGFVNQKNIRIPSILWFECRWDKDVAFDHLFEAWIRLSHPDIGMLHLFTDAERASLQSSAGNSFAVGSFGGPAKPGLPNIGWAMAYGGDYAAEVDVARIENAGFPVREVGGAIVVRVTEKLSDVIDDFATFSRRRAELKRFFRPGLFWIEEEPVTV